MADQAAVPEDQEFFKLNEVCKVANVQPYMLRFWGTEFAQLEAAKSGTGQRLYSRDQVEVILEIRRLLFDEGLTIAGARKRINALQDEGKLPTPEVPTLPDEEAAPAAKTGDRDSAPGKGKAAPAAKRKAAAKVDTSEGKRSEPLLATLKDVREEVAKIIAALKPE
jgi:DNA-binding transcriptional MerR regulator